MDVRDVGVALWRQRALVLVVLLVTAGAVVAGVLLAPKTWTATATVSVVTDDTDPDALRASLAELAASTEVVDRARAGLGSDRTTEQLRREVDGTWVRDTVLVEVSAGDRDPDVAAEVATAVARALADPDVRDDLGYPDAEVSVRDEAAVPTSFSSPDLRLAGGLGALFALGLATVAAITRDRRTHTADDATDIEAAASAPLLAHLAAPRDLTQLPALRAGSAEADVFRHLRVALEHDGRAGGRHTVLAGIGAGDTHVWVGANVAIALAATGARVLLVDGRMGERFGPPAEEAPDTPGLYDVLLGADLDAALSPGPVERLQVLPPGTHGDTPVLELLAEGFAEVMRTAATGFDHVLVLGPPLEECEDSRVMAVDASLVLTVIEGAVSTSALRAHADRVRAVGTRLLGVVLVARRPVPANARTGGVSA